MTANFKLIKKGLIFVAGILIVALTFQNCGGTITGNPARDISSLDIKFAPFQSMLKSAELCVSNVRLKAGSIFTDIKTDQIVPLPSGESNNGFDVAYFYYDAAAKSYFVNGIYLNKRVQLSQLGTLISSVTFPRGNYEQMVIGFSNCHDEAVPAIAVPSIKVENDSGTYADSADGQFVLIYEGARFVEGVDKGEFEIQFFTDQLKTVQSQNDLTQVLSPYRQFDILSFSATTFTSFYRARLNDLKNQSSGKLIAGGYAYQWSNYYLVARFNSDGKLDPTFGGNNAIMPGVAVQPASSSIYGATHLAIGSDDSIFAVGHRNSNDSVRILDVGIVKLNPDGVLDANFGENGWFTLARAGSQYSSDVLALDDGRLLLSANTHGRQPNGMHEFLLFRLTSEGELDPTFGDSGVSTGFYVNSNPSDKMPLAVQDDKKIILGMTNNDPGGPSWIVRRFLPNGAVDTAFNQLNTPGQIKFFANGNAKIQGIKIQQDQKILVAGDVGRNSGLAVARLMPDGTLDESFGDHGIYQQTFDDLTIKTRGIELSDDSEILVTGSIQGATGSSYFLLALDLNGTPKFFSDPSTLRLFSVNEGAAGGVLLYPPGDQFYIGGSAPLNVMHILGLKK